MMINYREKKAELLKKKVQNSSKMLKTTEKIQAKLTK